MPDGVRMRPLRIIIAVLLLAVIAVGVTAIVAWRSQERIIEAVLSGIATDTGYRIVPRGSRIAFSSHLVVVLKQPSVYLNGDEVARLDDLRASIRYRTIFKSTGLPLYDIVFNHPRVRITAKLAGLTPRGFPKPDVTMVERLKWMLDSISDVAQRIVIVNAVLHDMDGAPLVDRLSLTAYRQHRGPGEWPWMVSVEAGWSHAPFNGVTAAGKFRLGKSPEGASGISANGLLSFAGLDLTSFRGFGAVQASGIAGGSLKFTLHQDGQLRGVADAGVTRLALLGEQFIAPVALGDLTVHTAYNASIDRFELDQLTLTKNGAAMLEGGLVVDRPYEATRTAAVRIAGVRLDLARTAAWMRRVRAIPAQVIEVASRFTTGQMVVSQAAFHPTTPVRDWGSRTLIDNLTVSGQLARVGFDPPKALKLPPIRRLDLAVSYGNGLATFTQGSMQIGASALTGIAAEADLRRSPAWVSYKLHGKGTLDVGELYPVLDRILAVIDPGLEEHIAGVGGTAAVQFEGASKLAGLNWRAPESYTLNVAPRRVELAIKGAPSAIVLDGGSVRLRPAEMVLNHLVGKLPAPAPGSATVDGSIGLGHDPVFRNLVVDFSAFRTETWLPLLVDPAQLSAQGPISGRLTARSDARHVAVPLITGSLTMGVGEVQPGFLRSPIAVKVMTVLLDGRGMKVEAPDAAIEGSPVTLTVSMAQFAKPLLHLNANVADLDFEVMRFIRMPWSPKTPNVVFDLPIEGHITAARGRFGKLPLNGINTDFDRMNGQWHVRNFTARTLAGKARLNLSGLSGPDNHIRIKAGLENIDAQAMCLMMGQKDAAISGRLTAAGDLSANTDVNFFSSLNGKIWISAVKGTLNRFALMTRILSFIDLKNWLTARLPDTRTSGIPFDNLSATLNGSAGTFNTKDLKLVGPVMEITARGDLRLTDNTLNMEISMIPFDTVNWLVSHIPIIGGNLAGGSHGLVAAYFQVSGPIGNPSVTPKPITSVAEFVAKTLSLPINILAPNTIKP